MPRKSVTDELNPNIEKDCVAILRFLNTFIGKPLRELPTMRRLCSSEHDLYEGRYLNDKQDAMRSKIEDRLRLINERADVFGEVELFGTIDCQATFRMKANGAWDTNIKGKAIRYGVRNRFVSTEIPNPIGKDALSILSFFHKFGEEVYLPNLVNLSEIMDAFKRRFGVEDEDGVRRNPFLATDPITRRAPCDFFNYPADGCSLVRERDALDGADGATFFDKILCLVHDCYKAKEMVSIRYNSPENGPNNFIWDPVIANVVFKNGSVFLFGAIWDVKKKQYWKCKGGTAPLVRMLKIDRILEVNKTSIKSTLPKEHFDRIAKNVRTNDGIYYVPPESRFDAIIKVSPSYIYYDECVPFRDDSAKQRLTTDKLAIIGQPASAICYFIKNTNMVHLTNTIIGSAGNIVVLSPDEAVQEINQEIKRILECQSFAEPKGVAPVIFPGFKSHPKASSMARKGDLPKTIPPEVG